MNEKKIFDDLNFKENLKFWRALHTSVFVLILKLIKKRDGGEKEEDGDDVKR